MVRCVDQTLVMAFFFFWSSPNFFLFRPISDRVDRAAATKAVDSGTISGWIKPKTIKLGVHSRGGVEDTRLEAKAKDTKKIRGQGQLFGGQTLSRPRTKDTGASALQKKGLQKFFSGDLQFIGVARIFDWGRPKPQITCNDVIKIFPKRKFLWDKDIAGCSRVARISQRGGFF